MTPDYQRYRIPIVVLSCLLLAIGAVVFRSFHSDLFPDISFEKIKVIADAGERPVDRMMTMVTIPLENAIKRTDGLDYIRSSTNRGSCELSIFLKSHTDVERARQQIESFVNEAQNSLPTGTTLSVRAMNPSILPIMGYSVEGPYSAVELRSIAIRTIKPYLSAVSGVSDVSVIGGRTKEYQVVVDPYKLSTLGLSPTLIQHAIEQSNIFQANGFVNDHNRLYLTLTDNAVLTLSQLKELVIQNTPERLLRLQDVASVQIQEARELVRINANAQDVPLIAIVKQPTANLLDISSSVDERLKGLEQVLPKGVHLVPYYRQVDFVQRTIASIRDVLWVGLALALMVVFIALRSPGSSLVLLCSVPLTISLSLIILSLLGYTFNIMTLGALAASLGLVIDDAVIVVEQIHRSREEEPDVPTPRIVQRVMRMLFPSMLGSSLSTAVIFAPFVVMSGVAGSYFSIMAYTMMIVLMSSFIVSWLVLPSLFLVIPQRLARQLQKHETSSVHHFKSTWLESVLHRWWIPATVVISSAVVLFVLPARLPSGFLPEMDEGSIVCDFSSPPGTTLDQSDGMLKVVDDLIRQTPEVQSFSRRLGTQMGFFITEPNYGDYLIQLREDRKRSTDQITEDIRQRIHEMVPQLKVDFGQVISDMLGDLMTSVQPIELKIFGDDPKTLNALSTQVADIVRLVPGTEDVFDGVVVAGPELNIQPNVPKLAQLGLSPEDFHFQLQTQLEGSVAGTVQDHEQLVNIRVMYPDALRTSIHGLSMASILLPNGMMKPISTVATITPEAGVAEIQRENQKTMGVISARLNGRDLGSTLHDIEQKVRESVVLPPSYHISIGGAYAQQQQAFSELLEILAAALLLIFCVNVFLFREIGAALVVVVVALLGISGSVAALALSGVSLNVGSYMGIIMVVGIIAENAIFTLAIYGLARPQASVRQSVHYAIASRLRPKLMTATCSIVALLPLALGIGTGAQLHQPLAIAVIGGLVVALPLLLIVLPFVLLKSAVLKPEAHAVSPVEIELDLKAEDSSENENGNS